MPGLDNPMFKLNKSLRLSALVFEKSRGLTKLKYSMAVTFLIIFSVVRRERCFWHNRA